MEQRTAALHRRAAHFWTPRGAESGRRPGAAPRSDGHPAAWATRGIECLQPGETVLAWDPATRRVRPQRIEATFVRTTRRLRVLEIADGRGEVQTLHTTDEHPFWSVDRRQFVAAGELHPGEGLLGLDGSLLHLLGSRVEHHPRGITVYNLRVAHDHTYFAAASPASAPLLVHNTDNCTDPPSPDPHRDAPPEDVGAPKTARIAGGPFKGFAKWGRGTVKWGIGAKGAAARAAKITAEEAKALDPAEVRATKQFYEAIFKENPANAAAKARAELMDRILELQGGK